MRRSWPKDYAWRMSRPRGRREKPGPTIRRAAASVTVPAIAGPKHRIHDGAAPEPEKISRQN